VRLAVVSDIHANLTALEAVTIDLRTEQITIRRVEYDVASECPDAQWIAEMLRKGTPLPPPQQKER